MSRVDPRRPGNVVLRRARVRPETVRIRVRRRRWSLRPSPWLLAGSFAGLIAVGTLLLSLPIAAESRDWTSGWTSLFTATSAVSVTGLVRVDTAEHWSGFGEVVILGLIQLGGLGVTMYMGALVLIAGRRLGLTGRQFFGMELAGGGDWDTGRLLRRVIIFTVTVETVTFLLLLPWFVDHGDDANAVWRAFFHAISAANNAGFDVQGGLASFRGEVSSGYLLAVMGASAFVGSLSFVTVFNLRRRPRRWSLDTKFVVMGMGGLLILGIVLLTAGEVQQGRPLAGLGAVDVLANGFFLSVQRTTGMSTIDMAGLRESTTAVLLVLMFIGGASTSVAGGIKMGAFMVGIAVVVSSMRGRQRTEAFGREIPESIVLRAIAVVALGLTTLAVGVWALALADDVPFVSGVFEVMSALANVGWSHGVTPTLTTTGAMILVVLMYLGRVGPLMIALSVPERPRTTYRYPSEGVRIG